MSSGTRTLSEHESKRRLASAGVAVAPERLAADAAEAERAASELGFPVVVKLCGDRIAHKTERSLVRLGLTNVAQVRIAAEALLAAARPEDGAVALLVASMIPGRRELIAGCVQDPTFGPCVMLGIGGIFAEVLADVAFRLVPFDRTEALDLIAELQNQAWLGPFRGEPAVDRERLADVLVGLSRLMEGDADVVSVDLNPLIVCDGEPIAVDALVEVRAS